MNYKKVNELIEFYKEKKDILNENGLEGYKWEILYFIRGEIISYYRRHYNKGKWDDDFSDFHDFTRRTIGKTGNLVFSSSRSVMQRAADKYPERVRKMFIDLSGLNSEIPLEERVRIFVDEINLIARENRDISKSGKSFHDDFRAVSVYLLMMNPKEYYNYMYSTFASFANFVGLNIPASRDVQILLEYYQVCDEIKMILQKKYTDWYEEIIQIQMSSDIDGEGRTDVYGHLLVQDIIFSLYYYNHPENIEKLRSEIVYPTKLNKKPIRR